MTTRTADEADLSLSDSEREAMRPRINLNLAIETPAPAGPGDELDILNFIPVPPPDPLQIHGWDKHSTMDNLSTFQINAWNKDSGPKLLTYKAYGGKIDDHSELSKLRDIITLALEPENSPTVAPPSPEHDRGKRDANPLCTFVKDILPEQVQDLLSRVSTLPPEATGRT